MGPGQGSLGSDTGTGAEIGWVKNGLRGGACCGSGCRFEVLAVFASVDVVVSSVERERQGEGVQGH